MYQKHWMTRSLDKPRGEHQASRDACPRGIENSCSSFARMVENAISQIALKKRWGFDQTLSFQWRQTTAAVSGDCWWHIARPANVLHKSA